MYENNTAAVKVGNEVSDWFCIKSAVNCVNSRKIVLNQEGKSGVKLGYVLSPIIWIILMDFVLRSTEKRLETMESNWGEKLYWT